MSFELKGVVMYFEFNLFFFVLGVLLALGAVGWLLYGLLLIKFDAQSGYVRRLEDSCLELGDDMDFLFKRLADLDNSVSGG